MWVKVKNHLEYGVSCRVSTLTACSLQSMEKAEKLPPGPHRIARATNPPTLLFRSVLKSGLCSSHHFGFLATLSLFASPVWIIHLSHAQSCLTLCDPMDCKSTRLLCPWDFPGKNTGVVCHAPQQRIFSILGSILSLLSLLYCRWILYCLSHREACLDYGSCIFMLALEFFKKLT